MKKVDLREEWYDDKKKVSVVIVDVTESARKLAAGHLCGPVSAYYLAKALASSALLASETSEKDEALSIQMKCTGPLGGFNVECTADGALRGYTEKKVLDEFDGIPDRDDRKILGSQQIQVTRSVPGRIISQGISGSIDGYLAGSLQRRACIYLSAETNQEAEVLHARGVLVEALPDSKESVSEFILNDSISQPANCLRRWVCRRQSPSKRRHCALSAVARRNGRSQCWALWMRRSVPNSHPRSTSPAICAAVRSP